MVDSLAFAYVFNMPKWISHAVSVSYAALISPTLACGMLQGWLSPRGNGSKLDISAGGVVFHRGTAVGFGDGFVRVWDVTYDVDVHVRLWDYFSPCRVRNGMCVS